MKLMMAIDRRTYAGSPTDIVRKLRAAAPHMKTRDLDSYMRRVAARLREEDQVEIDLDGESQEERCEAFLVGSVRSRLLLPVFQREHVDSAAIRVLRRARGLTQEQLASLLQVSFTTVNRWEAAGERLSSKLSIMEYVDEQLFAYFWRSEEKPARPAAVVTPLTKFLQGVRKQTRKGFGASTEIIDPILHHKHT